MERRRSCGGFLPRDGIDPWRCEYSVRIFQNFLVHQLTGISGKKSDFVTLSPRPTAACRTSGFLSSGMDPLPFQPWTVDTGRPIALAIGRTPPKDAMMFAT